MNYVQRRLPESELAAAAAPDALRALLHTILFARWPECVAPADVSLDAHFPGLTYATCGHRDVGDRVDAAVRGFMASLVDAGPDLQKGAVTLTFFKRRVSKVVFWQYQEKVVWEEWVVPLLVNSEEDDDERWGGSRLSPDERSRLRSQRNARYTEGLRGRLRDLLAMLNGDVDHVPPASDGSHDFEFSFASQPAGGGGGGGARGAERAAAVSTGGAFDRARVVSAPPVV